MTATKAHACLPLTTVAKPSSMQVCSFMTAFEVQSCLQVKVFCEDQGKCRHAQLLQYFGETLAIRRCSQHCDVCLNAV